MHKIIRHQQAHLQELQGRSQSRLEAIHSLGKHKTARKKLQHDNNPRIKNFVTILAALTRDRASAIQVHTITEIPSIIYSRKYLCQNYTLNNNWLLVEAFYREFILQ